eukprot:3904389-Pyramimonas_sp.AAC.1
MELFASNDTPSSDGFELLTSPRPTQSLTSLKNRILIRKTRARSTIMLSTHATPPMLGGPELSRQPKE